MPGTKFDSIKPDKRFNICLIHSSGGCDFVFLLLLTVPCTAGNGHGNGQKRCPGQEFYSNIYNIDPYIGHYLLS